MTSRQHSFRPPLAVRALALVSACMVMLLSLAAVSPELHDWLHGWHVGKADACPHHHHPGATAQHGSDDSDRSDPAHDCAVTLFSHGVVQHAAFAVAQPCEGILRAVNYRAFEQLALAQPRYLHLPPQAPPAV
jgi:hypothetical protein